MELLEETNGSHWQAASCLSKLSWNTRISRTRLTTVEGLSLSAAPELIVQSLDDVLQHVQKLGLPKCKFDDIEHEAQIGEGESFQVERCRYNNKIVAVKHIKFTGLHADSQNFYRRLRTVLTELLIMHHTPLSDHPNVLSVLGYGWKTSGQNLLPYIVVEYCEHGSLRTWLKQSVKDIKTKMILCGDIASGLTALHLCEIIHGDLKLDNVVVLPSWDRPSNAIAKLCDFGHSIILGEKVKYPKYYGTLLYNAPEVHLQETFGLEPTCLHKCDIWAYGLLVWEIFADGKKYFNRDWERDTRYSSKAVAYQVPGSNLHHVADDNKSLNTPSSQVERRLDSLKGTDKPLTALSLSNQAKEQTPTPTPLESESSQLTFGTFDQKHLRALGKAFISRLPFPNCTIEKGYILRLLDRCLEVDPSVRLSRIIQLPIMTKWNLSDSSSLKEKLAIHTGSSVPSFKESKQSYLTYLLMLITEQMFREDQEREIRWEHQRQILQDFERIATYQSFQEEASAAALQVAICYIVGFGTSPHNDNATRFLRRAEELGHPMVLLFGQVLQSVTSSIPADLCVPYNGLVVKGFKEQRMLKATIFELHKKDVPSSTTARRFNNYDSFRDWLNRIRSLDLSQLSTSYLVTVPPTLKMNIFESFIAMEDVGSILRWTNVVTQFETTVSGEPLLIQACRKANITMVQALLEAGVDPERCTREGLTIYHLLFMLGDGARTIGHLLSKSPRTVNKKLYDQPCSKQYILHPQWPLELSGSPLAFAITSASMAGVVALLDIGADPTAPIHMQSGTDDSKFIWTPIHLAMKYHLSDILQLLLTEARRMKSDIESLFTENFQAELSCSVVYSTPLERYAMHGLNHRQKLLDTMKSVPVAAFCLSRKDGRTAIMQAIDFSDLAVVNALLQLNPAVAKVHVHDPKIRSSYDTPVAFACQIAALRDSAAALDIVKKLIQANAGNIRMRDSQGRTPLHLAVTGFSSSVAEWLLDHGASVHDVDCDGRTPLHYAGSAANIRILLDAKAQINCTDKKGFAAIHLAALAGLEENVKVLIERGADLKIANYESGTPLHCAVFKRSQSIVSELLKHTSSTNVSATVDVNSQDLGSRNTPLHLAAQTCRADIVRLLFKYGANAQLKNKYMLTTLHQCVWFGSAVFVRSFLAAAGPLSPLIDATDLNGRTPLHLAATFASTETVVLLLKHGAQVDFRSNDGDTALHLAMNASNADVNRKEGDRLQTCKVLYSHGADLLAENNLGHCAWDFALQRLDFPLMGLLLENGGPKACRYSTMPGDARGKKLLNVAI